MLSHHLRRTACLYYVFKGHPSPPAPCPGLPLDLRPRPLKTPGPGPATGNQTRAPGLLRLGAGRGSRPHARPRSKAGPSPGLSGRDPLLPARPPHPHPPQHVALSHGLSPQGPRCNEHAQLREPADRPGPTAQGGCQAGFLATTPASRPQAPHPGNPQLREPQLEAAPNPGGHGGREVPALEYHSGSPTLRRATPKTKMPGETPSSCELDGSARPGGRVGVHRRDTGDSAPTQRALGKPHWAPAA